LISNYSAAQSYLQNKLYPIQFSWAYCYIQTQFTASITITQRAKSENNVLKLDDLHTSSLVRLTHQIHARIEEEKRYTEFENEKTRNIVTGIPHINEKFFEPIL